MLPQLEDLPPVTTTPHDHPEPLPFPFNQRTFCRYEPIEQRIPAARVLVVNDLLQSESDISEQARADWGERHVAAHLQRERNIATLAIENILGNIERLVQQPETRVAHLSEIAEAAAEFRPEAIVLSGTLSDFDYYNSDLIDSFSRFIRQTPTAVLGICGGHELIGLAFGARVVTLDNLEQHERRERSLYEYQYRFVRIIELEDPIFTGIDDGDSGVWQDYTKEASILRVWQNHGLQLDRVPDDFKLLATSYLCRNQMMVRRTEEQLIYSVQFHLEKSFEDHSRFFEDGDVEQSQATRRRRTLNRQAAARTRWMHLSESRDGRILFENFLQEAINHSEKLK